MLAEAEAAESEAQDVYDKLVQENAVVKATKQGDIKGKTAEAKQLEVALGNYKEDKATTSSELDAVLTYLDKYALAHAYVCVIPECDFVVGDVMVSRTVRCVVRLSFSCALRGGYLMGRRFLSVVHSVGGYCRRECG